MENIKQECLYVLITNVMKNLIFTMISFGLGEINNRLITGKWQKTEHLLKKEIKE